MKANVEAKLSLQLQVTLGIQTDGKKEKKIFQKAPLELN